MLAALLTLRKKLFNISKIINNLSNNKNKYQNYLTKLNNDQKPKSKNGINGKLKKSEEIIKRKKIKKEFEKWKKRKDFEMKKKVQNEKRIKQMENEKKRYSGTPNKKFPIGPYTDAKAIKEMQTYLIGKINTRC